MKKLSLFFLFASIFDPVEDCLAISEKFDAILIHLDLITKHLANSMESPIVFFLEGFTDEDAIHRRTDHPNPVGWKKYPKSRLRICAE